MLTVRCTKTLLSRFGAPPDSPVSAEPPTTRLGDWHAKVLYRPGAELVLFVNDRSLLPVVVRAQPRDLIAVSFVEALRAILSRLHVPAETAAVELAEMSTLQLAPTRSRQILGTMNDFDRMLDSEARPGSSLVDIALRLAEAPCGPISMQSPQDVAVELLAAGE